MLLFPDHRLQSRIQLPAGRVEPLQILDVDVLVSVGVVIPASDEPRRKPGDV